MAETADQIQKMFKGGFQMLLGQSGAAVFSLISYLVMASFLGANDFGLLSTIQASVAVLIQLFTFQTGKAYLHFVQRIPHSTHADFYKNRLFKRCFYLDLCGCLCAFSAAWFILPIIGHALNFNENELFYAQLYALTAISGLSHLPLIILQIEHKFKAIAIFLSAVSFIRLIALLLTSLFTEPAHLLILYLIIWGAGEILNLLIIGHHALSHIPRQVQKPADTESFSILHPKFFSFVVITSINAILRLFPKDGDIILVSFLMGPVFAGQLRLIKQISSIIMRIIDPFTQAFLPNYNAFIAQEKFDEAKRLEHKMLKSCFIIALVGFTGIAAFGYPLLALINEQYTPVYGSLVLFTFAGCILASLAPYSPICIALGIPERSMFCLLVASLIYVASILIAAPYNQLWLVSLGYVAYGFVWAILIKVIVHHKMKMGHAV